MFIERVPERVVHARGAAAREYSVVEASPRKLTKFGTKTTDGSFTLHTAIPEFTHANVLNEVGKTTPVFLRFSTVQGSRGSADTVRDVRGFAVRMYTEQGNWDIVGNNIERRPCFMSIS